MGGSTPKAVDHATRERALRDVVVQIGARLGNLALGVVVTALVVRTLGDAGYGEWATLLALVEIASVFMQFGMERVAIREAAADPDRAADWVGALVMTRIALSLPVVAIGIVVLLSLQQSTEMLVAGLILLAELPLSVGSALQVVHTLRMRNAVPMAVMTINSVMWGVLVVAIWLADGGLVAFAIALAGTTIFTSLIQAVAAIRIAPFALRPSRAAMVRLLRTGVSVGVAGMLVVAYAKVGQLLVFSMAGASAAGFYGAVYMILDRAHVVPVSVMTTLAPVTASAWPHRRDRLMQVVRLASEFLAIASLGGLAVAIVAAEPIVTLLFGDDFAPAAPALPVLGGAFTLICFSYLTGNLMLVLGLTRKMVTVALLAFAANIAGNLLLIPPYGFMGAAWVVLATELVVVSAGVWFISRVIPIHRMPLGRLARIVATAAMTCALLAVVQAAGAGLAVVLVVAAVVYPALLLLLRAVALDELRTLRQLRGAT